MTMLSNPISSFRLLSFAACTAVIATMAINSAVAKPVPGNLANGLDALVENNLIQQGTITAAPTKTSTTTAVKTGKTSAAKTRVAATSTTMSFTAYKDSVAKRASKISADAISEPATGKYLVDIMPNGRVPLATLQSSLQTQFPLLNVTAVDTKYVGHGVIEGFVSINDVPAMAQTNGVGSVILQLRPINRVGAVTEFGVNQHRVNRVSTLYNAAAAHNYDGTGMTIGALSDTYNQAVANPGSLLNFTKAEEDVASGDLPGTGNTVNSQPVVVLQDGTDPTTATDEGRAMLQIIHDVAPKARIGFATAHGGEVGFANNIRALAGLPGFTYPSGVQQGFAADVVCDDVIYIDEPMFQDGIVAQGVIDVVNAGKSYSSSAGNDWGTDGYASTFRPVANGTGVTAPANTALIGTNVNLTGVDPALYAGGFHNFNSTGGQDVAQTINTANDAGFFIFQWNDPYDSSAPNLIEPPIFQGDGTSAAGAEVSFTPPPFTAGHLYVITENATGTPPVDDFDAIVRVTDPNGKVIIDQDTGVDEVVTLFAPISGQYTITVHPYATTPPAYTHGPFHVKVNEGTNVSGITQDFNCLFFDMAGNFISATTDNSFVNNRPYELIRPSFNADGFTQVQMLISRSNTTAPTIAANQLKMSWLGNGLSGVGPAEYRNYLTPITFGHSTAAGANCVAAYDVFRPNIPEDFTSPGPVTIYFDSNNNRLATPQVRQKPDIAAADGSNNTFFPAGPAPLVTESQYDADTTWPNFYGTSAASPHAAALSALVLQAHGGPGTLTPSQVKTILQITAYPHDLDPYVATGTASGANGGTVSINVQSDNSRNTGTGSNDPNVFTVSYTGPGRLATLNFNADATPLTGGNPTGGNFNGNPTGNLVADFLDPSKYSYTPGMVWTSTFLFGSSTGLVAGDVTHTRTNPAPFPANPSPANTTQHTWTLNLGFPNNNFTTGKVLRFNNGRSQWQDATVPQGQTTAVLVRQDYSADMLGSGVLIPEYGDAPVIKEGMTFNGTIVDGATTHPFSGRLVNKIGKGYSVLDGYGFINIEAATAAAVPIPGVVSRKVHDVAGTFDVALPINGPAGIECREGNGSYTIVYTFDRTVSSAGNASVTQGSASAGTPTLGPNANQVTVNLSNVNNAQHLIITLSNVRDVSSNLLGAVPARMDLLVGDTNADGAVNSGDISQTKSESGHVVSGSNFREDLNVDGTLNSGDISLVKSKSGTGF
jgi:hypothetical protein